MKKELNWISISESMPDIEAVFIVCEINGLDINNYSVNVYCTMEDDGVKFFVDDNFELLTWKPTHWAYVHFPISEELI